MPTTATTDPFAPFTNDEFAWLSDYCPRCVNRCVRQVDALAVPMAVTWRRGKKFLSCEYSCDSCGTTWTASELWPAAVVGALA